jgi:hypothetical protein
MLVNTIIKESNSGASLKAEIRTNSESNDYFVKYYVNGELSKITRYPFNTIHEVNEQVNAWMQSVQSLNG